MKIMVVDDERYILFGLQSYISKIDDPKCMVEIATNGKQALEKMELSSVDILITDIQMEGMSGLELIEQAAKKNYARHFIILSGYDKFEYARTALRLSVVDYLLKPIDKEELRKIICQIDRKMKPVEELDLLVPYRQYLLHLEPEDISPLLNKCMDFIRKNYRDGISLSMLSEYTGRTENYLCELVKKGLGTTFQGIVNEMRLRDALYLLLYEPSLPVGNIAERVGYHTERQLFRLIKNYLGITPQQVRNHELPKSLDNQAK